METFTSLRRLQIKLKVFPLGEEKKSKSQRARSFSTNDPGFFWQVSFSGIFQDCRSVCRRKEVLHMYRRLEFSLPCLSSPKRQPLFLINFYLPSVFFFLEAQAAWKQNVLARKIIYWPSIPFLTYRPESQVFGHTHYVQLYIIGKKPRAASGYFCRFSAKALKNKLFLGPLNSPTNPTPIHFKKHAKNALTKRK